MTSIGEAWNQASGITGIDTINTEVGFVFGASLALLEVLWWACVAYVAAARSVLDRLRIQVPPQIPRRHNAPCLSSLDDRQRAHAGHRPGQVSACRQADDLVDVLVRLGRLLYEHVGGASMDVDALVEQGLA